ncbi:MAG: hypothetical protein GF355_09690 [Candidatus Eisenbacteria bacterium]|nr:hypothetical protein [Candidatus Eisenbacteria bacterium]
MGFLEAIAMDTGDGLEDRADGCPSFPELGGLERGGGVIAEDDSQNGQIGEDLAGGQVGDTLAIVAGVLSGAGRGPTPGAENAGLLDQPVKIETPALDVGTVDGKLGRE